MGVTSAGHGGGLQPLGAAVAMPISLSVCLMQLAVVWNPFESLRPYLVGATARNSQVALSEWRDVEEAEKRATGTGATFALSLRMLESYEVRLAVERLYRAHAKWVRTIARRRFGAAPSEADDVAQKVFMVAGSLISKGELAGCPKAWLTEITRRVCANERRAAWRRRGEPLHELTRMSVTPDEFEIERNLHLKRWIGRCWEQVPQAQQQAFILVEVYGLTLNEASRTEGISLDTVASRVRAVRLRAQGLTNRLPLH